MAKKRNRTTKPSKQPASTTSEDGKGDNHNDQEVQSLNRRLNWAAIPGKRLDVDIAECESDEAQQQPSKKKIHSSKAANKTITEKFDDSGEDDPSDDQFDTDKWMSKHYDDDDERTSRKAELDLFDPDAKTDKFDAGSKMEGAGDAGMFLSLEVIPGDAYRVEKTGDENIGYTTKVVFSKNYGDDDTASKKEVKDINSANSKKQDKSKKREREDNIDNGPGEETTGSGQGARYDQLDLKSLSRKERQKLKRKARQEQAKERTKERKRLKSGQSESDGPSESKGPASASTPKVAGPSADVASTKSPQATPSTTLKVDETNSTKSTKSTKSPQPMSSTTSKASIPKVNETKSSRATPSTTSKVDETNKEEEEANEQAITNLQTTWSISALGVTLHPTLCTGLHALKFAYPTPIQSATLPAAILGRRDIVGAAPTGSGKTLSYGLPILQYLLESADAQNNEGPNNGSNDTNGEDESSQPIEKPPLQALILTPTRELAMQVTSELQKVCCNSIKIGTIVGGFAEVKQRRTLEKTRPPVLVCTPGRLWEMMSSREYSHLNDLSKLGFLVVDEADRMIKQGNFPQLKQIFEVVNQGNPAPEESESEEESSDDDDEDDRLKGLPGGVRGQARVVMLDDSILAAIERERNGGKDLPKPKPMEMDDDEYEQQQLLMEDDDSENDEEDVVELVHRQTFVYSATLTLPPSMHHLIKKDLAATSKKSSKKKKGKKQPTTVGGAIDEILDIAGARGQTKIVDMSNLVPEGKAQSSKKDGADKKTAPSMASRLPPGLTLGQVQCAQRHKDSHLYAYLVTTRQGSSGPSLVFCNSIACVRRVGETLKTLGLPVKMLHAQMQQKSRLSALESLRTSNSRCIVVASDVAARGLDIPSVTTVVHYDVARAVDTFIHRSGRTARGVGAKAVGTSISLVAPAEEREHLKICQAVQGDESKSLEQVHIDSRLLSEATARVALATKIVSCNDVESQASRSNKWLQDAAAGAGLEVDEDMMEGGLLDGDKRDRQRFLEAKRAKGELRQLLAQPMRKQHFGKFLSGAGLRESIKSEGEVKPFVVKPSSNRRKKKNKQA